jgi:hypothetical protein
MEPFIATQPGRVNYNHEFSKIPQSPAEQGIKIVLPVSHRGLED